jgi:hypothetical protein
MRPVSIVQFERLFLAALALGALVDALTWHGEVAAAAKAYPQFAGIVPLVVPCIMLAAIAIGVALWYFVARRGSVAAKWIVAGWFVVSTVLLALSVLTLVRGGAFAMPMAIGWVAYLLRAWSVSYLFQPDAEAWFASSQ